MGGFEEGRVKVLELGMRGVGPGLGFGAKMGMGWSRMSCFALVL
jgi:hypothetical protein